MIERLPIALFALAVLAWSAPVAAEESMVQRLAPQGLYDTSAWGYSQVTKAAGTHVFIAGLVAYDADGEFVGAGDFAAQARQTARNLRIALEAAGATPADLTRVRIYIVDLPNTDTRVLSAALEEELYRGAPRPTSTLLGVAALARSEFLIEIDADAVITEE